MKTQLRAAAVLAALALSVPAAAQAPAAASQGGKFGVGVGLSTADNGSNVGQLLFVPLNVAPNFRIEPFLGWARSDTDSAPQGFAPPAGEFSDFSLGVGGFFVQPIATQTQLYLGARVALQWQSFKDAGTGDRSERTNFLLAPTLGAEYMPHPRIALGADLMLGLALFGDTEFRDGATGVTVEGDGGSGSFTQGSVFVRFYLF